MSHLAMASLVAVCLSFALTVLYFGFAAISRSEWIDRSRCGDRDHLE